MASRYGYLLSITNGVYEPPTPALPKFSTATVNAWSSSLLKCHDMQSEQMVVLCLDGVAGPRQQSLSPGTEIMVGWGLERREKGE